MANFEIFDPFSHSDVAALSSTIVRENIKNGIFTGINLKLKKYIKQSWAYAK